MGEIGVTAVVEGLAAFVGDMDKIQSSIEKIGPPASILQNAFGALGEAAGNFASWVGDVLTYTLGNLLADAIESVVSFMGELIQKTIEAGNEFQTLTLRLNGMNMNDLIKSGMDYNTATVASIALTREQLNWLQKLAAATPYDNTDISMTYSLGRSYGFVDEEARHLTETTADFASAMGLSGDTLERIIRNFGQMKARGKITGTELRDLARGAFLPLDDVLGRVAKSMGVTTTALMKMISTPGEGVPFQLFVDAFNQMVEQEPRFVGASERMARTFKSASDNVMDLVTSFGGLNVVTPILDVLGGKIAAFMDSFIRSDVAGQQFTALGERLKSAAAGIGFWLSAILRDILGLLPGSQDLATTLTQGLEGFRDWLANNKDGIVERIKGIFDWLMSIGTTDFFKEGGILSKLGDLYNFGLWLFDIFGKLYDQLFSLSEVNITGDLTAPPKTGWQDLVDAIGILGFSIGEVLRPVLKEWGIVLSQNQITVHDFAMALTEISKWIYDNRETLQWLLRAFIAFVIVQTVTNLIWGLLAGLVSLVAGVILTATALGVITTLFIGVVAAVQFVITTIAVAKLSFDLFAIAIQTAAELIIGYFNNMETTFRSIITRIDTAWRSEDWVGIGWAIISGVADGIMRNVNMLIGAVTNAAQQAYNAAMNALEAHSPSQLFAGVGENMMLGMAQGITESASVAAAAMQDAVSSVTMPAMAAPSVMAQYTSAPSTISNVYQQSNQYNLSIHSNANSEDVAASFGMMQSVAGA